MIGYVMFVVIVAVVCFIAGALTQKKNEIF